MSENRPHIIKRKKVVQGPHGGSWKIALADFMTAMMALFLVMWLISSSSKTELEGIAEYFRTPLLVAIAGGDKPTASTSAIPGGGTDPAHAEGEVMRIDKREQSRPAEIQRNFQDLQQRIDEALSQDAELNNLHDQIRSFITPEGLHIQLLDSERRPMYQLGSDKVAPYMRKLLRTIAPLLTELPNRLVISGHTDSIPYRGSDSDYSNWELSADRANAARRELSAGGFDNQKLLRVVGMADELPLPDTRPNDPVNRRIEIIVLDPTASPELGRLRSWLASNP